MPWSALRGCEGSSFDRNTARISKPNWARRLPCWGNWWTWPPISTALSRAREAGGTGRPRVATSTRPTKSAASVWQTRSKHSAKIWCRGGRRKDPARRRRSRRSCPFCRRWRGSSPSSRRHFRGRPRSESSCRLPWTRNNPRAFSLATPFPTPPTCNLPCAARLAAMASYIIYTAIDWPGLSTSIATCIITALSTIGSSRQKQFLRLMRGDHWRHYLWHWSADLCAALPRLDCRLYRLVYGGHRHLLVDCDRFRKAFLSWRAARPGLLPDQSAGIHHPDFALHCPRPCLRGSAWFDVHVAHLRSLVGEECARGNADRSLPAIWRCLPS